jgi:CBS domain-containing protein
MQVRDLMTRQVVTIGASESCQEAVGLMYRLKVRHLPVVDTGGALVGVVTDRDLRHHFFKPRVFADLGTFSVEQVLKAVPVSEVMSAPVVTTAPGEDLLAAARLMIEDKLGSLPVIEAGRVVGIVTETDLLRQLCRANAACSPEVTEIVVSYP